MVTIVASKGFVEAAEAEHGKSFRLMTLSKTPSGRVQKMKKQGRQFSNVKRFARIS